jgi:hypothetical protein
LLAPQPPPATPTPVAILSSSGQGYDELAAFVGNCFGSNNQARSGN